MASASSKRSKARTVVMRFEPLKSAVNDEDANVDVLRVDRYVHFALHCACLVSVAHSRDQMKVWALESVRNFSL